MRNQSFILTPSDRQSVIVPFGIKKNAYLVQRKITAFAATCQADHLFFMNSTHKGSTTTTFSNRHLIFESRIIALHFNHLNACITSKFFEFNSNSIFSMLIKIPIKVKSNLKFSCFFIEILIP